MDLTDPGTAHAMLVALALAHGLDPGVGGIEASWHHTTANDGWYVRGAEDGNSHPWFEFVNHVHHKRAVCAPLVAEETNPIAALEAAVKHILGRGFDLTSDRAAMIAADAADSAPPPSGGRSERDSGGDT